MAERLSPQPGEWIDRNQQVDFRFEGRAYRGYSGDVLCTALWANGVRLMGRSFKYHRPRSFCSLAGHDANVIVENGTQTNLRGDLLKIKPGIDVRAVNTAGGLEKDRNRFIGWFSRFLPVGFYYKAFHTPRWLFPHYENMMRRAAGLGHINVRAREPVLPKTYDFCELLIVGAGPAGLSAALAAAEAGVDVLIVDEQAQLGGSLCWQLPDAAAILQDLKDRVHSNKNIRVRVVTQAGGWYADHWVALVSEEGLTKLRTNATIVAAGCIEQPAVFHNNDLPGVMLGSAAQRLIRLYAVKPMDRAVVLAANVDGYRVAIDLASVGVVVAAVVDMRPDGECSPLRNAVASMGIEILDGHAIYEAVPNSKHEGVSAAAICPFDAKTIPPSSTMRRIACDGIGVSVGWAPSASLLAQAGTKFRYDPRVEQLVPHEFPQGVFAAGRLRGVYPIDAQLADGRRTGLAAAAYLEKDVTAPPALEITGPALSHPYPIVPHPKTKNFVDFDEDLQLIDFVHAHHEGYDSVELLKRYSTVGMGPSQGKLSNMNSARILARLNNQSLEKTGTTTARPFHQPVSIAQLAGRRFHPYRLTPMDAWHRRAGANMVHVGAWFRPEYYRIAGTSRDDCIFEEACCVRQRVGLIDLSTLTKIQICGPDAAAFLERVYASSFTKLQLGRLQYAFACDESGIVVEEGLVARLSDDRFYITASTAGGDAFYRELQRWALVFRMNVVLSNLTGQWAAMNLAGPEARHVLAPLTECDLSSTAFPMGGVFEAEVAGIPAVFMRVGFVGELGFEIHLPALEAQNVWSSLIDEGSRFNIRPFGIEAQRLLRLEKGHLIAGHDTDALTNPYEAQLDWAIGKNKSFFIGQRSLEMIRRRPIERNLVGISFAPNYAGPMPQECQLIIDKGHIVGRVTSIANRSTVGGAIGLAFVRPDLAEPGAKVRVRSSAGTFAEAEVCKLPFYDPENKRQAM